MFKYKLENISLNIEKLDDLSIPEIGDRIIVKSGDVVKFSYNEVVKNLEALHKLKRELGGQIIHEEAVISNVEHFHPFIEAMSEADLLTAWMYKEAKGRSMGYDIKLKEVDTVIADVEAEIVMMHEQIPELVAVEVVAEEVKDAE